MPACSISNKASRMSDRNWQNTRTGWQSVIKQSQKQYTLMTVQCQQTLLLTSPHTFIISPPWSFISLSRFLSRSDMQSFHFKIPRSSAKTKWLHIFNNSPVTKNHSKWKILPTIQEQNNVGSFLNAGIYFSDSTVLHQIARI